MKRITQAYVSESLSGFRNKFLAKYQLNQISDTSMPAVFFGMYRPEDLRKIAEHQAPTILIWGGTDALKSSRYSEDLLKIKSIKHIAISNFISESLKINQIESQLLHITPTFLIKNQKPRGENLYFYHGTHGPDTRNFYGGEIIDQLKERIPFKIIECTKDSHAAEDLNKVYESCFLGLRFTKHDGLPNTLCELGLMGRRCIHNGALPNAIAFNNIEDIIENIFLEYQNKDQDNTMLVNQVYDYLNIGDSWLYL
jgi:hypothetical protein